jgi:GNAT superfamily N-acetyltransferase
MRRYARKREAQNYSRAYVWPFEDDPTRVAGFYALSVYVVNRPEMTKPLQNKTVVGIPAPVALIGFMGRDDAAPKGLGSALLYDAALRVDEIRKAIGIWGLFLHAENEQLAKWYEGHGFFRCQQTNRAMYAPLSRFLPDPKS